ncbi:MAG: DUF2062 domain-containing protein [Marinospirillum sp.]|uniref:DUF2062 domain-containing protein n=1 Tax=Marinospirillum sp. TaxID=2183934 RepID=UPI001A0366B5|nr:DUF2062 domain-containing protein [Marinospirillum sp.]MBE0506126.1 DUF2062 domain-containing protein [Marinospirillum sp.]
MPRKIIKRYLPRPESFKDHASLKFLSSHLADPGVWTLTRNSVSGAFSIGLFFAFMPMPFQMLAAALLAIFFRVNLPISVGLVWVSNPLTMPAMLYVCYLLGAWVLDLPVYPSPSSGMMDWISTQFRHIWKPLLLGCVLAGAIAAILANIAVRLIWRWQVSISWNRRQQKRLPPPKKN